MIAFAMGLVPRAQHSVVIDAEQTPLLVAKARFMLMSFYTIEQLDIWKRYVNAATISTKDRRGACARRGHRMVHPSRPRGVGDRPHWIPDRRLAQGSARPRDATA